MIFIFSRRIIKIVVVWSYILTASPINTIINKIYLNWIIVYK